MIYDGAEADILSEDQKTSSKCHIRHLNKSIFIFYISDNSVKLCSAQLRKEDGRIIVCVSHADVNVVGTHRV